MKRILQGATLIGLSAVVGILLMEAVLQLFPSLLPVELHLVVQDRGREHPVIGNLPAPNSDGVIWTRDFKVPHTVDAQGFRNDNPWPEQADIVVIGDSLVFGYGVERNAAWPQLMEERLGRDVLNMGLIGAGPEQYARIYETFARPLKPRVVVIGFFASNEFWDTEMFERWRESGVGGNYMEWRDFGRQTAEDLDRIPPRVALFLRKHSHLANLFHFVRRAFRSRGQGGGEILELGTGESLRLDLNYLAKIAKHSQGDNAYFEAAVDAMGRLHQLTQADGTRLLVVFQPSKEEVYFPMAGREPMDPATPIRLRLEALGIECVDLIQPFRDAAARGEKLFFTNDGHPNHAGYELTAEETASHLRAAVASVPIS